MSIRRRSASEPGEKTLDDLRVFVEPRLTVLEEQREVHYWAARETEKDPDGDYWPAYPSRKSWDEVRAKADFWGRAILGQLINRCGLRRRFPSPSSLRTLVGRLAEGLTNHSERATVVSSLAALGVDKGRRNMLGRRSPDGPDDYVQTRRAVVRELLGEFMVPVVAGLSSETYDEGEIVTEVGKRLKARDIEETDVDSWAADFKGKAMVISRPSGPRGPARPRRLRACRAWTWTPASRRK